MSMMKSTSGQKWRAAREVRDRLDQTEVHAEGILDELFAVAGDRARPRYAYAVAAQLV